MALPRSAREIEIDGVTYRWMVTKNDSALALTIQSTEGGPLLRAVMQAGQPLPSWIDSKKEVRRRALAKLTREEKELLGLHNWSLEPSDIVRFIRQNVPSQTELARKLKKVQHGRFTR